MRSPFVTMLVGVVLAAVPIAAALALFPSGGGTIIVILVPFATPGFLLLAWALGRSSGDPSS